MRFEILEKTETLNRVALHGRLDSAGVDEVEVKFNAALSPSRRNAIVDMTQVEFLASTGIRMLLTVAKILNRSGSRLVLLGPTTLVAETLRHSGLESFLPVAADLEAARGLLVAPPA